MQVRKLEPWRIGLLTLSSLLILGSLYSCASVEAPKGGPEDKTPPRVVAISPAPRTINADRKLDVQIQFNEWIMNPVPRAAIRISPPLEGKISTEVDGDLLEIRSEASLDTLTTYTITIGSVLKDLHQNSVTKPFQLVFSTGPQIDTLRLRGQILLPDSLVRQKKYPTIGLFPVGTTQRSLKNYLVKLRDSTNPGTDSTPRLHVEPALYIGEADSMGRFQIDGIAPGRYRVLAFLDVNGNNHIDPSLEIGGLADRDVTLDSTYHDTLFWTIGNLDTAHPLLVSATPISPLAARLEFNRPIQPDSSFQRHCFLRNPDSSLYSQVKAHWLSTNPLHYILAFDSAQVDSVYLLGCDPENLIRTTWLLPKDTLVQKVSQFKLLGPSPSADSIPKMEITFVVPVQLDTLTNKLALLSGKDTLPLTLELVDPIRIQAKPTKGLPMGLSFKVVMFIPDTLKDTKQAHTLGSFETVSSIKLSKVMGHVPHCTHTTRIRLRSPGKAHTWIAKCASQGEFKFDRIPEGSYFMDLFEDLDQDSLPSVGSLFPYKPGETWRSIPDTIHVGNDLLPTTLDSLLYRYPLPQRTP